MFYCIGWWAISVGGDTQNTEIVDASVEQVDGKGEKESYFPPAILFHHFLIASEFQCAAIFCYNISVVERLAVFRKCMPHKHL